MRKPASNTFKMTRAYLALQALANIINVTRIVSHIGLSGSYTERQYHSPGPMYLNAHGQASDRQTSEARLHLLTRCKHGL